MDAIVRDVRCIGDLSPPFGQSVTQSTGSDRRFALLSWIVAELSNCHTHTVLMRVFRLRSRYITTPYIFLGIIGSVQQGAGRVNQLRKFVGCLIFLDTGTDLEHSPLGNATSARIMTALFWLFVQSTYCSSFYSSFYSSYSTLPSTLPIPLFLCLLFLLISLASYSSRHWWPKWSAASNLLT